MVFVFTTAFQSLVNYTYYNLHINEIMFGVLYSKFWTIYGGKKKKQCGLKWA